MFENLSDRLSGTLKRLRGQGRLTEDNIKDTLREIRMALLEADVALPVVREFVDACKAEGLAHGLYLSPWDRHEPSYGKEGYNAFFQRQITELLTQYGEIGGIWFDGMWDKPDADWRLGETYALIHELQPGALIGSNHHKMPFPGEDFMMFERDIVTDAGLFFQFR